MVRVPHQEAGGGGGRKADQQLGVTHTGELGHKLGKAGDKMPKVGSRKRRVG